MANRSSCFPNSHTEIPQSGLRIQLIYQQFTFIQHAQPLIPQKKTVRKLLNVSTSLANLLPLLMQHPSDIDKELFFTTHSIAKWLIYSFQIQHKEHHESNLRNNEYYFLRMKDASYIGIDMLLDKYIVPRELSSRTFWTKIWVSGSMETSTKTMAILLQLRTWHGRCFRESLASGMSSRDKPRQSSSSAQNA